MIGPPSTVLSLPYATDAGPWPCVVKVYPVGGRVQAYDFHRGLWSYTCSRQTEHDFSVRLFTSLTMAKFRRLTGLRSIGSCGSSNHAQGHQGGICGSVGEGHFAFQLGFASRPMNLLCCRIAYLPTRRLSELSKIFRPCVIRLSRGWDEVYQRHLASKPMPVAQANMAKGAQDGKKAP
jgi:hypothetical protein